MTIKLIDIEGEEKEVQVFDTEEEAKKKHEEEKKRLAEKIDNFRRDQ